MRWVAHDKFKPICALAEIKLRALAQQNWTLAKQHTNIDLPLHSRVCQHCTQRSQVNSVHMRVCACLCVWVPGFGCMHVNLLVCQVGSSADSFRQVRTLCI